jgi:hypothetical protein
MDRQHALESLNWHYQTMSRQLPATLQGLSFESRADAADLNR